MTPTFQAPKQPSYGNLTVKKHFRSYDVIEKKVNKTLIYSRRMRKRTGREKKFSKSE